MKDLPVKHVLGTPLCCTSYDAFNAHVLEMAGRDGTLSVDFTNTQIVTMRRHGPAFRRITETVDCFVPDAMPLVWCLNLQGAKLRDRVYGPAFMNHCLGSSPPGVKHYFLGGSEECLAMLRVRMTAANPGLTIAGMHHGYFQPEHERGILEEINRLSPDFLWVGLGTPKQQEWIHRNKPAIRRGVILAVGYAFDVNAGTKRDQPMWMQRLGLGWLFRLCSEPRRLLGRYLKYNTLFLFYLLRDGLCGKAWTPADTGAVPRPPN